MPVRKGVKLVLACLVCLAVIAGVVILVQRILD
jgi:hypothetical protein